MVYRNSSLCEWCILNSTSMHRVAFRHMQQGSMLALVHRHCEANSSQGSMLANIHSPEQRPKDLIRSRNEKCIAVKCRNEWRFTMCWKYQSKRLNRLLSPGLFLTTWCTTMAQRRVCVQLFISVFLSPSWSYTCLFPAWCSPLVSWTMCGCKWRHQVQEQV